MGDIKIGGVSIFYSEGEQEFQLSDGGYDLIRMGATEKEIKTLINYFRCFLPDHKNIEAECDALKKAIFQFKENPISKNKFKMFDLIEGQG